MYLGVDESNHGRHPEIFVGCYTHDKAFIHEGCFPKQRSISHREFQGIPFQHLIFSKHDLNDVGKKNYPLVAVAELAMYVNALAPLDKIFIDGEISSDRIENLERLLHTINRKTRIVAGAHLDTIIPLVNEADNRANFLYRYYLKNKNFTKSAYKGNLIMQEPDRYSRYLL